MIETVGMVWRGEGDPREVFFYTHQHPWYKRDVLPPCDSVKADRIIVNETLVFVVQGKDDDGEAVWLVREYPKEDVRRFDYITKDLKEMFPTEEV